MIDLEVAGHALYSTPGNAPYTIFVICVQQPAQSWSVYRCAVQPSPAAPVRLHLTSRHPFFSPGQAPLDVQSALRASRDDDDRRALSAAALHGRG